MGDTPLRDRIREALLEDLVEGRLAGEDRIGISPLADRFEVSPTPAREALTQLEAEGWLVLRPNRGFFVAPMTVREAESIYPILATLESLAVELQGEFPAGRRWRLRSLNEEMRAATAEPDRAFELDRTWHETLTEACGNSILLDQVRTLRRRAERYERAYMRHSGRVPSSTGDHRRIEEALEVGPETVAGLLQAHWEESLRFVRRWWGESGRDGGESA